MISYLHEKSLHINNSTHIQCDQILEEKVAKSISKVD